MQKIKSTKNNEPTIINPIDLLINYQTQKSTQETTTKTTKAAKKQKFNSSYI